MLKIPYGISDFAMMRKENYIYIDKTSYIRKLEKLGSKYIFFIRPRRFGKSLFLSTLANYYDINQKESFEKLFLKLDIGKKPTDLHNTYLILNLNFSGLDTDGKKELKYSFRLRLLRAVIAVFDNYSYFFADIEKKKEELKKIKDISGILEFLFMQVKNINQKIYLIIDEYDHFANDIIAMGDDAFYKEIIRATGFVRKFYETVKIGTGEVVDRIFITGISPIMLDDLTSGFNIADNITMSRLTNQMLGFTDREVEEIVSKFQAVSRTGKTEKELIVELQKNYNGYLFNKDCQQRVYNPDMILFFFKQLVQNDEFPEQLIDDNVKTDYGRLNKLVAGERNREKLEEIIVNEKIVADIVSRFSYDMMYNEEYFVSLLFYLGLLTIDKKERTRLILKIPNFVVKTIFWEYIEKRLTQNYNLNLDLEQLREAVEKMAYEGIIQPYLDYISGNVLGNLSNRDLINFDEKYIKIILFTFMINSKVYRPFSESEVKQGYLDIYLEKDLRMPDVKYEWIIELKYLKESEKQKLAQVRKDGLKQLKKYAADRKFVGKENLKKVLIIFTGKQKFEVVYLD